jgi:hypothetical protein
MGYIIRPKSEAMGGTRPGDRYESSFPSHFEQTAARVRASVSEETRATGLNAAHSHKVIDVHNVRLRERARPSALLSATAVTAHCSSTFVLRDAQA